MKTNEVKDISADLTQPTISGQMASDNPVQNSNETDIFFKEMTDENIDQELLDFVEIVISDAIEEFDFLQKAELNQTDNSRHKGPKSAQNDSRLNAARQKFRLEGLVLEKMKVYNALNDVHLQQFLSKKNRKEILMKNGLLDEDGFIVTKPNDYLREKEIANKSSMNKSVHVSTIQIKQKSTKSPYEDVSWAFGDKILKSIYLKRKQNPKNKGVQSRVYQSASETIKGPKETKPLETKKDATNINKEQNKHKRPFINSSLKSQLKKENSTTETVNQSVKISSSDKLSCSEKSTNDKTDSFAKKMSCNFSSQKNDDLANNDGDFEDVADDFCEDHQSDKKGQTNNDFVLNHKERESQNEVNDQKESNEHEACGNAEDSFDKNHQDNDFANEDFENKEHPRIKEQQQTEKEGFEWEDDNGFQEEDQTESRKISSPIGIDGV